jgi:hypothetical protein
MGTPTPSLAGRSTFLEHTCGAPHARSTFPRLSRAFIDNGIRQVNSTTRWSSSGTRASRLTAMLARSTFDENLVRQGKSPYYKYIMCSKKTCLRLTDEVVMLAPGIQVIFAVSGSSRPGSILRELTVTCGACRSEEGSTWPYSVPVVGDASHFVIEKSP